MSDPDTTNKRIQGFITNAYPAEPVGVPTPVVGDNAPGRLHNAPLLPFRFLSSCFTG